MALLMIGSLFLVGTLLLEWIGVLLYVGYPAVRIVGCCCAALLFRQAWRDRGGIARLGPLAVGLAVLCVAFLVASLEWSPRKTFVKRAEQVRPGLSGVQVAEIMRGYETWSTNQKHVSYRFMSRPGTVDVLVVALDDAGRVTAADVSLD